MGSAKGRKLIIDTLNRFSVLTSSEAFEQKGALFNATIIGKKDYKKDTVYLPLKADNRMNNVEKYGAYSSLTGSYFFLVEHKDKKGNKIKSIEFVPLYLVKQLEEGKISLMDYAKDKLGLKEPKIIIEKIKTKTELEVDGFRYLLNGRSGNRLSIEPNIQMFWTVERTTDFKILLNKYNKYLEFSKNKRK